MVSDFIQVDLINNKGLIPTEEVIKGSDSSKYTFYAIRVTLQLAYEDNDKSNIILDKLLNFFDNQEVIYAWYDLDGVPVVNWSSTATDNTVAFAAKKMNKQSLFNKFKTRYENHEDEGYYADIIHALAYYND